MLNIIDFLNNDSVVLIGVFTPVILTLVSLCKTYVSNPKYYPVLSVVFGLALSVVFSGLALPYAILLGVLAGASASGFYSGVKAVVVN